MIFDDVALRRLKRDLHGFIAWGSDEEILALINRLEAAEKVCEWAAFNGDPGFYPVLEAWRKTLGESE